MSPVASSVVRRSIKLLSSTSSRQGKPEYFQGTLHSPVLPLRLYPSILTSGTPPSGGSTPPLPTFKYSPPTLCLEAVPPFSYPFAHRGPDEPYIYVVPKQEPSNRTQAALNRNRSPPRGVSHLPPLRAGSGSRRLHTYTKVEKTAGGVGLLFFSRGCARSSGLYVLTHPQRVLHRHRSHSI